MDWKTNLVVVIPTAFITSFMMNILDDNFGFVVALLISVILGVIGGLLALLIYRHLVKP